ncbi:DUF1648 domain-containing protein [Rummeliibacillus sp. JY-2-4R]
MMGFGISIIMLVFTGLVQIFIPYMVKKTVVFGVSIPATFINHIMVKRVKRIYSMALASIWIVMFIGYIVWCLLIPSNDDLQVIVGTSLLFLLIIMSMLFYAYFHRKLQLEKQQQQWGIDLKEVKLVDTSLRGKDEMLPLAYYIGLVVIPLILIIYTYSQYPLLPEQIPTHWGANGEPNAFTEKNPFTAISLPLMMLVLQIMFAAMSQGTKISGIKISVINTKESTRKQIEKRKYTSWFMFLTALLITMLFSLLQLTTIHHNVIGQGIMLTIFIIFMVVILVGSIIFSIKVSSLEKKNKYLNYPNGVMDVDEDRYWKGGLLYFNKDDSSLFVEKRFGIGWTINFARPMSYLLVFVPLIIILFIAFFSS